MVRNKFNKDILQTGLSTGINIDSDNSDILKSDVCSQEWVNMPEFVQKEKREWAKLTVRFRNREDLERFSSLIGQVIKIDEDSRYTKRIWFPVLETKSYTHLMYYDEEDVK